MCPLAHWSLSPFLSQTVTRSYIPSPRAWRVLWTAPHSNCKSVDFSNFRMLLSSSVKLTIVSDLFHYYQCSHSMKQTLSLLLFPTEKLNVENKHFSLFNGENPTWQTTVRLAKLRWSRLEYWDLTDKMSAVPDSATHVWTHQLSVANVTLFWMYTFRMR